MTYWSVQNRCLRKWTKWISILLFTTNIIDDNNNTASINSTTDNNKRYGRVHYTGVAAELQLVNERVHENELRECNLVNFVTSLPGK